MNNEQFTSGLHYRLRRVWRVPRRGKMLLRGNPDVGNSEFRSLSARSRGQIFSLSRRTNPPDLNSLAISCSQPERLFLCPFVRVTAFRTATMAGLSPQMYVISRAQSQRAQVPEVARHLWLPLDAHGLGQIAVTDYSR